MQRPNLIVMKTNYWETVQSLSCYSNNALFMHLHY